MRGADDATCILQPHLIYDTKGQIGKASAREVAEAARAVIQQCVIQRRIGGTASDIGEPGRGKWSG